MPNLMGVFSRVIRIESKGKPDIQKNSFAAYLINGSQGTATIPGSKVSLPYAGPNTSLGAGRNYQPGSGTGSLAQQEVQGSADHGWIAVAPYGPGFPGVFVPLAESDTFFTAVVIMAVPILTLGIPFYYKAGFYSDGTKDGSGGALQHVKDICNGGFSPAGPPINPGATFTTVQLSF